jgi:ATP-dependent RNA helicase RhlE
MTIRFSDFQLIEPLLQAVEAEGYTTPTPIQAQAIPPILAGRDLLGCAQTGTGKTAAFALPILHRMDTSRRPAVPGAPRVLVLCPTRELAAQIGASFQTYGQHLRFRQAVIFGGVGQQPQVRALDRGVHVLIATPGRLLDLMDQGHVRLNGLDTFVLDEADRMLDMGFLPDLQRILARLPRQRQSLFFSATLPERIVQLAEELLTAPVQVTVTPSASTVDVIDQRVLFVEQTNKRVLLRDVLDQAEVGRALVFTRTKRRADQVAQQLNRQGIRAEAIHSSKSQTTRQRLLHGFRSGSLRVLVATDLASRGIDVEGITHVINYDMPWEPESYVHRIGRTGRAGALGIALSFCDASERSCLRAIEKLIRRSISVHRDHAYHAPAAAERPKPPKRPGGNRHKGYGPRRREPRPVRAGV